jgi:hypothetical protein
VDYSGAFKNKRSSFGILDDKRQVRKLLLVVKERANSQLQLSGGMA